VHLLHILAGDRRVSADSATKASEFKDDQVQELEEGEEMNSSDRFRRPESRRTPALIPFACLDPNKCGLVSREGAKTSKRLHDQKSCHVGPERICPATDTISCTFVCPQFLLRGKATCADLNLPLILTLTKHWARFGNIY